MPSTTVPSQTVESLFEVEKENQPRQKPTGRLGGRYVHKPCREHVSDLSRPLRAQISSFPKVAGTKL